MVRDGSPVNVDLAALRRVLMEAQPDYRDPAITDCSTDDNTKRAETEYRAAMGLDEDNAAGDRRTYEWPENRTLYHASQN